MLETAEKFFWPCDEGKGWEACRQFCHEDATFTTDADTLKHLDKLDDYVEWMKEAHNMLSDVSFEIKGLAADTTRNVVLLYAVIKGQIALGNDPQPIQTDYVYSMSFEDGKIKHITKIWYFNV